MGNFRGLKQVDLPLMFQENKGESQSEDTVKNCQALLLKYVES